MYIKELTNKEFNDFTNTYSSYSIYQTSEYGFIMNNQKYTSVFLGMIDESERIVAASLILIEKTAMFKYAYAPKGYLIDYNNKYLVEEFTKLIKDYLNKKKIMAIKINPMIIKSSTDYTNNIEYTNDQFNDQMNFLKKLGYYHLGFNNLFEAFKPRFEAIIDISKPINEIYKNTTDDLKEKVKYADNCGIRVIKGKPEEIDYLYEEIKNVYPMNKKYFEDVLYFFKNRNLVDYHYTKLDTNEYLRNVQIKYQTQIDICSELNNKLFENIGKDNEEIINKKIIEEAKLNEIKNELVYATNLLKDNPNGIVTSTCITTKYKDEVYLFIDCYNKNFKSFNPKHLMIWKLIELYNKQGFKRFNLGGITNPKIDNKKYNNLNEFKLSFNARCIEYIGDLELITNSAYYALYRNSKPIRVILHKK